MREGAGLNLVIYRRFGSLPRNNRTYFCRLHAAGERVQLSVSFCWPNTGPLIEKARTFA